MIFVECIGVNMAFQIPLLIIDRRGVSIMFGVLLIRLKRIYNFLCSMLVYAPFALCFVTLHGVFMHFPELTYWRDATVPVPSFLLFLCFRKATQEIFSQLDETKAKVPIFPDARRGPKQRWRGARGQPYDRVARPTPGPRHQVVRPPGPPLDTALPPIYSPRRENPKPPINFPWNIL
jgi:hypothetical protein